MAGSVLPLFLIYFLVYFLTISVSQQCNYIDIYQTDLRQIFGFSRTTVLDDQSEMSFSIRRKAFISQTWQKKLHADLIR